MLSGEELKKFKKDGYFVIENFLSEEQCKSLIKECDNITDNYTLQDIKNLPVFEANTGSDQAQTRDEYFLTSIDKIRPFLENKASEILKDAKDDEPINKRIFNKIGHALHVFNPVFREVTFADNVKDIAKSLGYVKPLVLQSMYIFKQPFIGGEVKKHQDGSYLHVEPLKVTGVWIALEDATLENGCLYFCPGSHKGPLTHRFIRNPNKEEFDQGKYLMYTDLVAPIPNDEEFIPVEVKAGSAIIIDGLVFHRSGANNSPKSRNIYTFHMYESENAKFSDNNWMPYSEEAFLPLYEN